MRDSHRRPRARSSQAVPPRNRCAVAACLAALVLLVLAHTTITFSSITSLEPEIQQQVLPLEVETAITIYSEPRNDRSGAFLQDMLFCHAHAFAHNQTYGGCCEPEGQPAKHREDVQKLIQTLGLDGILRFACPLNHEHAQILSRDDYYKLDTRIWSKPWLSYIRGVVKYSESTYNRVPTMAIHIRRGDVQVCPDVDGRYLPNQHYLRLIEKYRPTPDTPVYVYSETESSEPWEDFSHDDNIHLQLDTPVDSVFMELVKAETLIMSKSSFSLTAAMLNQNKIIYTPFWHKPLPTWTVVPSEITFESDMERSRLRQMNGC